MVGDFMFSLAQALFPINRSLTGDGVRATLSILQGLLPELVTHEVPSGTEAFDWVVPKEWRVRQAYIITPSGERICDFTSNNLHLVGYSCPVRTRLPLNELDNYLYSLPEQPEAIPYVTSYYQERWGFCLSHAQREKLLPGEYEVVIDSDLFEGSLTYGELLLPGETAEEILLSTYICHPSMANNELSGPVVAAQLALWLQSLPRRRYSYRIVFIPETIGALVYLSRNLEYLQQHVKAGYVLTCIGDERAYSYLPSRNGDTLSDKAAKHVMGWLAPDHVCYPWSARGSDERQYCAPGVDLPVGSIMRSKYGIYPEYHTSLDTLGGVVTSKGLEGGYLVVRAALEALERNGRPRAMVLGEPQLGKRGLYPSLSTRDSGTQVAIRMELLTWADGKHTLMEIADKCGVPVWELYGEVETLTRAGLLEELWGF